MIRFSQMLAHHGEWKGRQIISRRTFDEFMAKKQTPPEIFEPYSTGAWIWGGWLGHEGAMSTDERANLRTGHSRVFMIQTENRAGKAFHQLKNEWHAACENKNTSLWKLTISITISGHISQFVAKVHRNVTTAASRA